MPKKPESALNFTIGRSRRLRQAVDYLHALSVSACWLNDLPPVISLILSSLVVMSWFVQRKACKTGHIYLRYTVSEGWSICFDGELYLVAEIKPTTVVGKMMTILHFSADNRSRTLLIVKDAMAANDYRRLIVNLKISGYSQE
ncbi:MAG: protein YgfX [Methylomonas sp.]